MAPSPAITPGSGLVRCGDEAATPTRSKLQIGGTVDGHNLDEARFRAFWTAVEDQGIPVILHPNGYPERQRLGDYFLSNCIGNPLERMVSATRMTFSGLFEQHPEMKLGGNAAALFAN